MSEITYIIVSEDVFEEPNKSRIIARPYSSLFLPALPNNFSFAISFGIIDLEYATNYKISVQMKDPKGKQLINESITHNLEGEKSDLIVTSDLTMYCKNFLFEEEGHYLIEVGIDDVKKSLKLPVYKANRDRG